MREFKQARSRATYEALIEAATQEFAERGYPAVQTPDIAARAGVSTGAFYRYFGDKREIFLELARFHLEHAHADVMQDLESKVPLAADPRAAVAMVIERIFLHARKRRDIERVFAAVALTDPDAARLRAEFVALRVSHLAALVDTLVSKAIAPRPAATAHVLQTAAIAMATEEERAGCKVADLQTALGDMIYAYLFAPAAAAKPASSAKP